jgi:hypothetical protein
MKIPRLIELGEFRRYWSSSRCCSRLAAVRSAKRLRFEIVRLFAVGAAVSLAVLVAACGSTSEGEPQQRAKTNAGSTLRLAANGSDSVSVPDVVGLSEADAVRALAAVGLIANVRYQQDAPRTGEVLRSTPAAEANSAAEAVVVLRISPLPRLPLPGPDEEQETHPFSSLVERNPGAFVGIYLDGAGVPHAVFGPDVDPTAWKARLSATAAGLPYKTDICSRDRRSLRAIQDEISTRQDWTENKHLAFGVGVDPATCTVRVESDLLTRSEIASLVDRYGVAISFDTSEGSHPELVSLG